jgi:uncharacterized protein YjiS (DUF1127 family)
MSVAKHLPYARSRSRTERPRRIDGPSFAHVHIHDDETARPWQRQASPRSVVAVTSVASPSIFRTIAQFAEAVGDILLTVASWILEKIFDGCITYAMAMHGIPADLVYEESGDLERSALPNLPRNSSRPILHVIEAETAGQIRARAALSAPDVAQPCADADCAARSEPTSSARSGWRTAIIAPTVLLLSKIRKGNVRRRAVAELESLDDRSLSDIGISRGDTSYMARYGAHPE